jgi:hypothetical protein
VTGPAGQQTSGSWIVMALRRMGGTLLPRTAIAVGIGTTIAMNVYGGLWDGGPGGALVASLYPVALVVSLETLIWMMRRYGPPARPLGEHWEQWLAAVTLGSLAGITGIISYLHALTVLERTGSLGLVAYLGPLVPDQLILTGTLALMAAARFTPKTTPAPARTIPPRTAPAPPPAGKSRTAATRTAKPAGVTRSEARTAELARIVNLVRQLQTVPGERALAAEHCGGSRRLARDVLAALATAQNGTRP